MAKADVNTLGTNDLISVLEARRDKLSPEQKARLSAVAAVIETRGDVGSTVEGGRIAPVNTEAIDKSADLPDLSTEQMQELLAAVEHRFNNHPEHYKNLNVLPRLEQNVTFAEVRVCLENDHALAKQVYAMLKRKGDPDVYSRYGKSLLFFESVQNTTAASRNCVYGEAQADWLRVNRPGEQFNGSVEEQRKAMGGVGVTAEQMWLDLQELGPFTNDSWEWTYSDDINDETPTGLARYAIRYGDEPYGNRGSARNHYPYRGWRALAKGSEA